MKSYRTNRGAKNNAGRTGLGVITVLGMYLRLKNRVENRQEGQGLVEYALILVFVSIAAIVGLTALGPQVADTFSKVNAALTAGL